MTIMEERAKHLGGRLSIDSEPGAGTRVTLTFVPSARAAAVTSAPSLPQI
jgi:two-component system nitrate/nitrite sensor histidine kinase NarX